MRPIHLWLTASACAALALDACGNAAISTPNVGDLTCSTATFNVEGRTFATFGTSADARKIDAFLQATIDLDRAVDEIHDGILASCTAIGRDLGIPESEYVAMGTEPRVATVCRRVKTEIETILRAGLSGNAALAVVVSPPVCRVDISVSAACYARCTGSVMTMVPTCHGTVVADCSGSCDAICSGSCSGGCTGQCSGTCTGSCMGTCNGECTGTCSAMDGTGRCIGTCSGTCRGSCSAMCMGSCSGTCTAGCQGSCMGQCRGMCTVASNVRCDGTWDAQADVQCEGACRAQANARAECTPAQVSIAASAMTNPAGLARLRTLLMSLQTNYPGILQNGYRLQAALTTTVPAFARSVDGAAGAAGRVGVSAVACITRAVAATAESASRVQASAQVTVDISASLTVRGGS